MLQVAAGAFSAVPPKSGRSARGLGIGLNSRCLVFARAARGWAGRRVRAAVIRVARALGLRARLGRQGTAVSPGVDRTRREVVRVKRPDAYFDAGNSQWPDEVEPEVALPRAVIDTYGKGNALERLRAELALQEEDARDEVRAQGWVVLGAERVLSMGPFRRATSFEPLRSREPHLASGRGQTSFRVAAIRALQAFRHAYRDAREAWARGVRKVVFPRGTWAMARYHAALVAPA